MLITSCVIRYKYFLVSFDLGGAFNLLPTINSEAENNDNNIYSKIRINIISLVSKLTLLKLEIVLIMLCVSANNQS